jgi:hypothetical protein
MVASQCERPLESQQVKNEHGVHKVQLAEGDHEVHQERYQDERRDVQGQDAPFRRANLDHCQYASRQLGHGSHRRPVEDSLVQKCSVKPAPWSAAPGSRRLVASHDGGVEVEPVHDADRLAVLDDHHAGHAVVDHSVSSLDLAVT